MVAATSVKVFFDTNILVYQFDQSAPNKQQQAQTLIAQAIADGQAVVSSQVVQEFTNVALTKFKQPLTADELRQFMAQIVQPLCQHVPSFGFYERALALYATHSLSFYDSLIVQAAVDLACTTLYSEDLQANQTFGNLTIINPFS